MTVRTHNIKPIRTQVLVIPCATESVSDGGILIPVELQETSNKVNVVAVGGGTKVKPMRFKEGQIAFRVKGWGTELNCDGQKLFLMDQEALIATI